MAKLRSGSSKEVIQSNIKALVEGDAGYDPPYKDPSRAKYTGKQAAAIAYAKAGQRKNSQEAKKGEKEVNNSAENDVQLPDGWKAVSES